MELPHLLQRANRRGELTELLGDPSFIIAKCRINQSNDLIADFDRLVHFSEDRRFVVLTGPSGFRIWQPKFPEPRLAPPRTAVRDGT